MPFVQIQFRRGTAEQWTTDNPLLAIGEMAIESDTQLFKIGDGVRRWRLLPYGGLHGPTGSTGVTGPTGFNGRTGYTGDTGAPGDRYLSATTTAMTPTPEEGGGQTLTIGTYLAYIPGNSVVVVDSANAANSFQGYVDTYSVSTGVIVLRDLSRITGDFGSSIYNVNLNGINGPTGSTGPGGLQKAYTLFLDYSAGNAISRIYLPPGFSTTPSLAAGGIFTADVGSDLVFLGTANIAITNTIDAFPIGLSATGYTASEYWQPTPQSSLGGTGVSWQNTADNTMSINSASASRINGGNVANRPSSGVLSGWLATLTIYYL